METTSHNTQIRKQFDIRSSTFDESAKWITDRKLIDAHVRLAGEPNGRALELCCGTGAVARGLQDAGWEVLGVDISEGMIAEAKRHVPAICADVSKAPLPARSFDLAVMRQAYFLLDDGPATLAKIREAMKPTGRLILSHLVPFSDVDADYLREVHTTKQAQMRKFHTRESLREELESNGFRVVGEANVVVRESVSLWMRQAPELSEETRQRVCQMVLQAPEAYRKLRNVELRNDEILEDWNFVLLLAEVK